MTEQLAFDLDGTDLVTEVISTVAAMTARLEADTARLDQLLQRFSPPEAAPHKRHTPAAVRQPTGRTLALSDEVSRVLAQARIEGTTLYLPPGQLERPLYQAVNTVLDAMGGTWNRKVKGHVFTEDPTETLEAALLTGSTAAHPRDAFAFFATPPALARQLCTAIPLASWHCVLEPSCGDGAIVVELKNVVADVDVCEIRPDAWQTTATRYGCTAVGADFLTYTPGPIYDAIVANPPFNRQQDITHVDHMLDCLKPGGWLSTLMSRGMTCRTTAKTLALKDRLDAECPGWTLIEVPAGTFKASGTMVGAVQLVAQRVAARGGQMTAEGSGAVGTDS